MVLLVARAGHFRQMPRSDGAAMPGPWKQNSARIGCVQLIGRCGTAGAVFGIGLAAADEPQTQRPWNICPICGASGWRRMRSPIDSN